MTQQYASQNINGPRTPRSVAPEGAVVSTPLLADDSLVHVDSSAADAAFAVILPPASEMPGAVIAVVALTGATNAIAAQVQGGDLLAIPATLAALLPLNTDGSLMTIQSDGVDGWQVLAVAK